MSAQISLDAFWGSRRMIQADDYSGNPLPKDLGPRQIVCLLGGPGSGKTTVGAAVAPACGYTHVCVGQLLKRHATQNQDAVAQEVQACISAGKLVPTATVILVLSRHLQSIKGPVILDGFPRVHQQIGVIDKLGTVQGVILLDCSEDVMRMRMSKDDCDDEISLLEQFTENCLPLVDIYDRAGLLHIVNTAKGIDEVTSDLESTIRSL